MLWWVCTLEVFVCLVLRCVVLGYFGLRVFDCFGLFWVVLFAACVDNLLVGIDLLWIDKGLVVW